MSNDSTKTNLKKTQKLTRSEQALVTEEPSVRAVEEFYLKVCSKYSCQPDYSVLIALKTNNSRLKPSRNYSEGDIFVLCHVLLALQGVDCSNFYDVSEFISKEKISNDLSNQTSKITQLDLSEGKIGSNGLIILSKVLEVNNTITDLNLRNNKIGPRGAYELAKCLKVNQTLKRINLHGNRLYQKGAAALTQILSESNHVVEYLDISNNHIGFEGVYELERALLKKNRKIQLNTDANAIKEEITNSFTHGIGFALSIFGTFFLIYESWHLSRTHIFACLVYGLSLIFLYGASCLFHGFFKLGMIKGVFERLDHCGIFTLIAGSYTPFCLLNFHDWKTAYVVLIYQWICAVLGIIIDVFGSRTFFWNIVLYVAQGWTGVLLYPFITEKIGSEGVFYLLVGGILYTVGIIFYVKGNSVPIYHAVWHVFVLFASLFHYFAVLWFALPCKLKH